MNPIAICEQVSGKIVGYACDKCRLMSTGAMFGGGPGALETAQKMADECCVPKVCAKHGVQKEPWGCKQCRDEHYAAKDAEAMAKATKVKLADYTGKYLYLDGHGNEGYFDVDSVEYEEDSDGNPLPWAWGCVTVNVTLEDCDLSNHVTETMMQEHHEEASESVDWAKVREAEKLLFEACKSVTSYQQDTSVVVLLQDEIAG